MEFKAKEVTLETVKLAPGRGPRRTGVYQGIVEACKKLPVGKGIQIADQFPKHFRFALRKHSIEAEFPLVVRKHEGGDYVIYPDTGYVPESAAKKPAKGKK